MIELESRKDIYKIEQKGSTQHLDIESVDYKRGFDKRFTTVKQRVRSIVKNDKDARKNYLWLYMVYLVKCGMIKLIVPLENFNKVNSPETVTRAFRKLVEEAKNGDPSLSFLLDEETLGARQQEEQNYRNYFAQEKLARRAVVVK